MFEVNIDSSKMTEVSNVIKSVAGAIETDLHINEVVKHANTLITAEFVMHMTREAMSNIHELAHVYEWNRVGDPTARLWRHVLRGSGAHRKLAFNFKASKTTVPVSPALRAVGVKQNHVFVWKAAVIEFGMPVNISPVVAKALVFEAKDSAGSGSSEGDAFVRNGIVYHEGTVRIPRQGSPRAWGAFTREFNSWFTSGQPDKVIAENITHRTQRVVKNAVKKKLAKISSKISKKKFSITPVGVDSQFEKTLVKSLVTDYARAAANRRVLVQDDEI